MSKRGKPTCIEGVFCSCGNCGNSLSVAKFKDGSVKLCMNHHMEMQGLGLAPIPSMVLNKKDIAKLVKILQEDEGVENDSN